MATIVLSAAGAALGASFGGTVLGLSSAVIGRAVGATLGRVIDQRLLGAGSDAVEVGRVDRFRLMGASEGSGMAQVYGRARIAGQVIWATRFAETASTSGGGKGAAAAQPSRPGGAWGCSGGGTSGRPATRWRNSAARLSSTVVIGTVIDSRMMISHTCSCGPRC